MTDTAYITVRLTETATGNHPQALDRRAGRYPVHPGATPGRRRRNTAAHPAGIALCDRGDDARTRRPGAGRCRRWRAPSRSSPIPAVLYTNNGTENSPAVLGKLTVDPKYISYADGFFMFPTQTLMHVTPDTAAGPDHSLRAGPEPRRLHVLRGHLGDDARVTRELRSAAASATTRASNNDPKAVHLRVRRQQVPERPADPAATEFCRGVEDHQLQQ